MRVHVEVRAAVPEDMDAISSLCLQARAESSVGSQLCTADAESIARQVAIFAALPGGHLDVALHEGELHGFMLTRVIDCDLIRAEPGLFLEAIYVDGGFRRRGGGHALMAVAAQRAVEAGAVDVYSQPLPGARGMQRFLARLGFAPAATHRVVTVPVLQRALSGDVPGRRGAGRTLEDLIARRRRSREESNSGPLDLRGLQESYVARQANGIMSLGRSDEFVVNDSTHQAS